METRRKRVVQSARERWEAIESRHRAAERAESHGNGNGNGNGVGGDGGGGGGGGHASSLSRVIKQLWTVEEVEVREWE